MASRVGRLKNRRRTAYVLSGGGNLGAIQVGMAQALADRGVTPDAIYGCSVGAVNGAAIAADPSAAGLRRLAEHWLEIDADEVMPSSWLPATVGLLRKGEALSSSDGLRTMVEGFLGENRSFDDLAVPFECVATDIERAAEHWFNQGDVVQAVMASAALPAVYPAVTIGRRRFTDGGVVDDVPIMRAVDAGFGRIYVLHVGNYDRPRQHPVRPLDALIQTYWIARRHRFVADMAAVPASVRVTLLPTGAPTSIRYNDFSQTAELLATARVATERFLAGADLGSSILADRPRSGSPDVPGVVDVGSRSPVESADDDSPDVGEETDGERAWRRIADRALPARLK